uniref:Uncharacterized protein n=1 Tax=Meloidogyne enterolobii TaxID=390850 RepID=A0A6V7XI10_MELEN|nr:unnamed protein product [Meloidogyne enterolobii]
MNQNLFSQILPEVDFNISSSGITVLSSRLTTPRFIPYDQSGRCKECKSTEVEIDFIVTKEGVTIYCTRIGSGTRFVPFDTVYELPTHCFFKVRNKGRVFNVPHGVQVQQIIHQNPKRGKRKCEELSSPTHHVSLTPPVNNLSSPPRNVSPTPPVNNLSSPPRHVSPPPVNNLSSPPRHVSPTPVNNLHSPPKHISPAVTPAECPKTITNTARPNTPPDNVEFEKELQEFYDSLMAATTGLTSTPKKLEEKVETEEKKDETNVPI